MSLDINDFLNNEDISKVEENNIWYFGVRDVQHYLGENFEVEEYKIFAIVFEYESTITQCATFDSIIKSLTKTE